MKLQSLSSEPPNWRFYELLISGRVVIFTSTLTVKSIRHYTFAKPVFFHGQDTYAGTHSWDAPEV